MPYERTPRRIVQSRVELLVATLPSNPEVTSTALFALTPVNGRCISFFCRSTVFLQYLEIRGIDSIFVADDSTQVPGSELELADVIVSPQHARQRKGEGVVNYSDGDVEGGREDEGLERYGARAFLPSIFSSSIFSLGTRKLV